MAEVKPAAVIFDMDGVIVDSEPRHERAFRDVFAAIGLGETHGIHFRDYYGKSDRVLWQDFLTRHSVDQTVEELAAWKHRLLVEFLREDEPIFEGVVELLTALADREFPLALASGSYHATIDTVLGMRNLRRFFPIRVSSQDVPRGKPAPDIFLETSRRLGLAPERCWVVEDSAAGVRAGKEAGMRVIGITNSLSREGLREADWVVEDYREIEELIVRGGTVG